MSKTVCMWILFCGCLFVCFFVFIHFFFKIFIVIRLQLYAFSPHPSTPPQLNPPPLLCMLNGAVAQRGKGKDKASA